MDFLEKDLEDVIYNSDKEKLGDRGLMISGKLFRQIRIGRYGVSDLISISRPAGIPIIEIEVFELKKDTIGPKAFWQAIRYVKGIDQYLTSRNVSFHYTFTINLIGRTLDSGDFIYLADYVINSDSGRFLNVYTYDYGIDGIEFTIHQNYKLTNEGFDKKPF